MFKSNGALLFTGVKNNIMDIKEFEEKVRAHSQDFDLSLVSSTNALAGEVGEVCNVSKKMEYYKHFPTYNTRVDKEILEGKRIAHPDKLKDELGDVLFYLIQCAQRGGFTVEDLIVSQSQKLDDTSVKLNKHFLK